MRIPYTQIKAPLVLLEKDENTIIWWSDGDDINFFDDLPDNYPRWTIGHFDNIDEALERYKLLLEEGYDVLLYNMDDYIESIQTGKKR
jgi:hypothetical protein